VIVADSELRFRVTGDAGGATRAFRAMVAPLQGVKREAAAAKTALAGIKSAKAKVSMDTKAIARARQEVARLRDEVGKQLQADVTADTRPAERRIRQLEASIRTLSKTTITPQVKPSGLNRLKSAIGGLTTGVQKFGSGAADAFKAIGVPVLGSIGVAVAGVATGLTAAGVKSLQLADDLEGSKIAFTKFLGSAEAADKFLQGLRGFAAKTPFEFPELVAAGQQLTGIGVAAKDVVPIMRTLGDAAAFTKQPVSDLASIYGQMFTKGKVANEELLQLSERGIPAYKILSERLGISAQKVEKLASEGKLGADALKQLQIGLDEKFGGGMAQLAGTLGGMISTLKDTMTGTLTDIGEAVLPLAKAVFPAIQKGAENLGRTVKTMMPTIIDSIASGLQGLLTLPGTIVRGVAGISLAVSGMLSGIMDQLATLMATLGKGFMKIPGMSEFGAELFKAAEQLDAAADKTRSAGKDTFTNLQKTAADADAAMSPIAKKIEEARRAAQGQIKLDLDVAKVDTQIQKATAKIDRLKDMKKNVTLDADKEHFDKKIEAAEQDLAKLQDKKATIQADLKIDNLREKVVEAKRKLAELKKQKTSPEVTAKINELEKKVKTGKSKLASLNKDRPTPRADLNNAALNASARKAAAKVKELDQKKAIAKADLDYSGVTSGVAAANRSTAGLKNRTITISVQRKLRAATGTGSQAGDFQGFAGASLMADPTGMRGVASAFAAAMPHSARAGRRTAGLGDALSDAGLLFGDSSIDLTAPAPQITISVRDKRLADFIDVRVDGKAAKATRVVQRKEVLQL
jgi:tape measure domain-containing protein